MMYFTYHDLKVDTDQTAYPNRVGGGQFITLKFDPILMVYMTNRYFKVKNCEMAYLLLRRRMVKGEMEGCLIADLFLYSYEAEFIQSLLSTGRKRLAPQFNFTYRYIDDVLTINNPDFENYLGQMYPPELRSKTREQHFCFLLGFTPVNR